MNNIIFCPTIPQSGTWFVLRMIEKCGYKIEHVGEILMRGEKNIPRVMNRDTPTILTAHIFPFYYQGTPFKETLPSFGGNPVNDYIVRRYHISINAIELLASLYRTVIPIRDPLNCLLTREARAPNLRHFYITDSFSEVAKRFMNHPNVEFLPVDLHMKSSVADRKKCLLSILSHLGIAVEKHEYVINDTAYEWKRENSISTNIYRESYEKGDIEKIKLLLGTKWAEVVHLKNHASTILPFMNSIGYNTARNPFLW